MISKEEQHCPIEGVVTSAYHIKKLRRDADHAEYNSGFEFQSESELSTNYS